MTFSTEVFDRDAAAVRAFDGRDVAGLPRHELLTLQSTLGRARRSLDALAAVAAGEIARRSSTDLGVGGLARREGYASPQQLIAKALGSTAGEAGRLVAVGQALAAADDAAPGPDAGVSAGGVFAVLAAAVRSGEVSVEAAAVVSRTLTSIHGDTAEAERRLVEAARRLSIYELKKVAQRTWAYTNPGALAERERRQYRERTLVMSEAIDGTTILTAKMDPASAAPIRAWLDAQVRHAFQQRRENKDDDRTAGQIRVDALAMLAAHGLDCETPTSGVKTTVVVRIDRDRIASELGVGECDGVSTPISAGTLRLMAVDAEILPEVLGGESLPLDLGRSRRLFTRAQKLALVERDGGCSWCHAPPSHCAVHHIRWWDRDRGRTDLDNALLLCTSCHHRIHYDDWRIDVKDGRVWFTPPRAIDPTLTPRLGGNAHLALAG